MTDKRNWLFTESLDEKYKHMSLNDRIEIQECLNKGMSFNVIAKRIGKDQTTVPKEVKNT